MPADDDMRHLQRRDGIGFFDLPLFAWGIYLAGYLLTAVSVLFGIVIMYLWASRATGAGAGAGVAHDLHPAYESTRLARERFGEPAAPPRLVIHSFALDSGRARLEDRTRSTPSGWARQTAV